MAIEGMNLFGFFGMGVWPLEIYVTVGQTYGPNGDDYLGALDLSLMTADHIVYGVTIDAGGYFEVTGNFTSPNTDGSTPDPSLVVNTAHFGEANATAGTLDMSLYTLTSGMVWPTAAQVLDTVIFGPTGAEYEGTVVLPAAGNVQDGVAFGPNHNDLQGDLVLPNEGQVLLGVSYGELGTEFTGNVTLPAVADVQETVTYGPFLTLTGEFVVPEVGVVKNGSTYGHDEEFTGEYKGVFLIDD